MDQSRGSLTLLSITLGSVQEAKLEMTFRKVVFSTKKGGAKASWKTAALIWAPKLLGRRKYKQFSQIDHKCRATMGVSHERFHREGVI